MQQRNPSFILKFIFEEYNQNSRVKPYWLISKKLWDKNGLLDSILIKRGYMK